MSMSNTKRKAARRRPRAVSDRSSGSMLASLAKNAVAAFLIAVAVGLLLLFIFTALLMQTKDPLRYHGTMGRAAILISALLGGMISAGLCRRAPLFAGLVTGALFLALALVGGLAYPAGGESESKLLSLLMTAALPALSVLGALTAGRKKQRRRSPRR